MKYILIVVALITAGVISYTIFNTEKQVNENTILAPIIQQDETNIEMKIEEKKEDKPVVVKSASTDTVKVKTFTLAEVAANASVTSCYSVVNGSVYNLTSWISKHPGGERAIKSICGTDGSDGFNGKHGGNLQPESTLATFKIGILAK